MPTTAAAKPKEVVFPWKEKGWNKDMYLKKNLHVIYVRVGMTRI